MKLLKDKIIKLLHYRIEQEEISARLYLAMSNWLKYNGFAGAGELMYKYGEEEWEHSQWVYKYLDDMNELAPVPTLPEQTIEFEGLVDVLEKSYKHEVEISIQCNELAKACVSEGDFLTFNLALKFTDEQVDEVAKAQYWLDRLEAFGSDDVALRLLDNEMKQEAIKESGLWPRTQTQTCPRL